MARIPDEVIEELKRNVSLARLCQERGIELKPAGKELKGLCPFHEEKKPSFHVNPDKNLFHCLGCDAKGSNIDFVMRFDTLDFRQAAEKLLALMPTGGPAAEAACPKLAERSRVAPERVAVLLDKVVSVYERAFLDDTTGRTYLEGRGISDAGLFVRHRVGLAGQRLKEILPSDGKARDELKAIGILLADGSERFASCVVFPVFDADGSLVTLYGRRITREIRETHEKEEEPGPNEVPSSFASLACLAGSSSSAPRHYFLPGRPTGLWNAAAMKTYSEIILVESVIDGLSVMMALRPGSGQAGQSNVIAIQGTNGLSEADIALLKTHGVQKVTLLLDGDEAGGKATGKLRPRLEAAGLTVAVKALPAGHDPNSYLVAQGAQALADFLACTEPCRSASAAWTPSERTRRASTTASGAGSVRATESPPPVAPAVTPNDSMTRTASVLSFGLRRYELRGLERGPRKLRVTLRVECAGKLHVDTLDLYHARARRTLAMDLCRVFDESPETIEADLEKLVRHSEALPEAALHPAVGQANADVPPMSAADRAKAESFGKSADFFDRLLADLKAYGLIGEENNIILDYVAMTSRKRETPLSVLTLSSSGAGKTALQDAVLALCPPEDLVKLTALSGKALFYKERLSLKHKVLALEEGDGAQEAMYAIRNLISAGELASESTIKDLATGRLTTMENKVEGPSSVFFTTTNPEVDPETKSRFWVTGINESREQTRAILAFQRQKHLSDEPLESPEIQAILRRHHNFQRLLKPLAVKNPYARQLTYGDDRLQGRRDQLKYLNLIKSIAFLRQMGKEVFHENRNGVAVPYIKADRDDLRLANRLAHEILGHSLDELSRPGRDLLEQLEAMVQAIGKRLKEEDKDRDPNRLSISFSRREIREFTGWSNPRVHRYLKELLDLEYVVLDSGRNGTLCRYRLTWEGQGKDGQRFMLGLADPDKLNEPSANREP